MDGEAKTACFIVLSVFSSAEQTTKQQFDSTWFLSAQKRIDRCTNFDALSLPIGLYPKGMTFFLWEEIYFISIVIYAGLGRRTDSQTKTVQWLSSDSFNDYEIQK